MDRSDVITLIGKTYTKDSIGQYVETEASTTVFCSVQSISQSEFFEAGRMGFKPSYKVTLFKYDYNNQPVVKYNGNRYGIYRTYEGRDDTLELYLREESGISHGNNA